MQRKIIKLVVTDFLRWVPISVIVFENLNANRRNALLANLLLYIIHYFSTK